MAEVSEEKKEYEKLEDSEEEQRKKEKQQAEEEAEKRRVMFLSILKGILKFFADAVMTVAAFAGATIQSFLFGRQTAFADDRNEINKFKRDVDDAKKMEKESKERNTDKSEQAKEQREESPENGKQEQEPPEKERQGQSDANKQEPPEKELTDEEMEKVCNQILFILGASFDGEMNQLMSELDERIVDSVYKLDLNRPKKSMMRKNMDNMDMKYCMKRLSTRTVLGKSQGNIFRLIMDIAYKEKNIDESKMSDQEFDDFIKSAAPKVYDEIKSDIEAFDQEL